MTQLTLTNPSPIRLTPEHLAEIAAAHGLTPAHLAAIADIEGSGSGYLPDGRPKILFEAHIFSRLTGHRFDASHPGISSFSWNRSLYKGGAGEYPRMSEAMALDETAALQSASWGLFQVMGKNYGPAGYSSVANFAADHVLGGEPAHLAALGRFLAARGLVDPLRRCDWPAFARGYNGPGQVEVYSKRLADAYAKHQQVAA